MFRTRKMTTLIPQKVLFSLGGSFLYYADRFKLYSAFCASHTKVPKVLAKGKTRELMGAKCFSGFFDAFPSSGSSLASC